LVLVALLERLGAWEYFVLIILEDWSRTFRGNVSGYFWDIRGNLAFSLYSHDNETKTRLVSNPLLLEAAENVFVFCSFLWFLSWWVEILDIIVVLKVS